MSKKLIALVLAVTFALSFTVKGATVEELQAQIAALLQQIQTLQAQLGQQSQTTGGYCFSTYLKLGMKSDEVKKLQLALGITPASGYFGPLTLQAVKQFQTRNGIKATGYVGPLTVKALNEEYCNPPTTVPPTTVPPATVPPESSTTTTTVAPSYG
ncbi:MAG: peptidoglycan-binding protein, partial [Minisyncoccia bacterium]